MIRTNILRAAGKRVHLPSSNRSLLSGTKTTRARQHLLDVAQPFPCFRHHIHCTPLNNPTPRNEVNLPLEHTSNPTALPPAPTDLLELYRGLVAAGRLNWDDEQVRCIMKLRQLLNTLHDYSPPLELVAKLNPSAPYIAQQKEQTSCWKGNKGTGEHLGFSRTNGEVEKRLVKVLSGEEELANLKTPKGILLTGPPGSGKSLLLSLFYQLLPIPKRRIHYHAFTLALYKDVFLEMNRRKSSDEEEWERKAKNKELAGRKGWKSVFAGGRWDEEGKERLVWAKEEGVAFNIARRMILEYTVLYFDEFQLIDASSAALIRDVLSWYWRLGGVIVTCSNRVPEDLYHHGVQKERLAGFLDALKTRCEVVQVDGGRDWRREIERGDQVRWFHSKQQHDFEKAWSAVIETQESKQKQIQVYGRTLTIPQAAGNTCRFTFSQLCEEALGPADYLALVSTFSTFFIDEVPTLYLRHKNEARRLINLIDALYESRCQVFLRSPSTPSTLFFPDALSLSSQEEETLTNERMMSAESLSATIQVPYRPNVSYYNNLSPAQRDREATEEKRKGTSFSVLGIWTGEDEKFAYKRAVSRLIEMTSSPSYAVEEWVPLEPTLRSWEGRPHLPGSASKTYKQLAASPSYEIDDEAKIDIDSGVVIGGSGSYHHKVNNESEDRKKLFRKDGDRIPPTPINEQHIWGVVDEWGEKAGRWGRGVKAFSRDPVASGVSCSCGKEKSCGK
ncbi:AFG1-family ATPase [Cryptococcus neoformans Bt85]|nr:AFG1-family ATPase [Cryptococcus neoformans var. grubii Bt85]